MPRNMYEWLNEAELAEFVQKWTNTAAAPQRFYVRARIGKTLKKAKVWRWANVNLVTETEADIPAFAVRTASQVADRLSKEAGESGLRAFVEIVEYANTSVEDSFEVDLPERSTGDEKPDLEESFKPSSLVKLFTEAHKASSKAFKDGLEERDSILNRYQDELHEAKEDIRDARKMNVKLMENNIKLQAELSVARSGAGYDPMMAHMVDTMGPMLPGLLSMAGPAMERIALMFAMWQAKRDQEQKKRAERKPEEAGKKPEEAKPEEQKMPDDPGAMFDELSQLAAAVLYENQDILTPDRWARCKQAIDMMQALARAKGLS